MPQLCKTCRHPERQRIEQMVLNGQSVNSVGKSYGLTATALQRHIREHVPKSLAKAQANIEGKPASNLLQRIQTLADQASSILQQARDSGSLDAANGAIGQALRAMELIGRITGEVPTGGNNINIALGVRMDVAQQSVQIVKDAQSIEPREVVERALRCVRAWNAMHPEDSVSI